MANVVERLSGALFMKPKIVGHEKDYIISPNLLRGWEARDKQFGDNAHNSLRAVLERSTGPYACDSSLAQDSKALEPAWSQMLKAGQHLPWPEIDAAFAVKHREPIRGGFRVCLLSGRDLTLLSLLLLLLPRRVGR